MDGVRTLEDAAMFVDDVGFALLFPSDRAPVPSLFEAVAGPDAVPFANGMGEAESAVWTWKDALPEAGLAWYGTFLYGRASLLSPRVLAALYPGDGDLDDHRALDLPADAHRIGEALLGGPLTSSALRELVGNRGRYDRSAKSLQRHLLTTSAGVREQRAGWPVALVDLTCRRFDVGSGSDREDLLSTMAGAVPAELRAAYRTTA